MLHRPNNHCYLDPIKNSPVLNELNLNSNDFTALGKRLTVEEWVKARQTQQQRRTKVKSISKDGVYVYEDKDLEILPGLSTKVY